MDFKNTLESWREVESKFASKLFLRKDRPVSVTLAPNKQFKDWDVKATFDREENPEVTFEIKRDWKSQETWNIALEVRCNNKPSGIYASKADYIVFCLSEGEFYFQNRWELLYRLDYMWKKLVKWWDGDRSEMYLVSKEELPLLFNKI